ncbi:laminin subunit alpha-like isoform X1 [Penaeus chinensis]|uniref:laminin subunit alpha-like isoform X1 n=1 Tax=Penaeus chinensis TaxID=139456 RepID=UPI001FB61D39|nr:laminin subunit alpha-like isoform X1 [Penaeus chinensis]
MRAHGSSGWALWVLALCTGASAQVLTPPYFNLAENRRITATATCGLDVADPELYCKLVGANADRGASFSDDLIQGGQFCDVCDPSRPDRHHPAEYAIDGSERWWQSPPLSRGMKYNEVNLTIDLGQLFQVAYVLIKMGNSPRPGVWVLERSVNNGESYTPWQYFADSPGDCENFFGTETLEPIEQDDDVTCVTHFSKVVPLEGGEIVVSLLNNRPSANSFFNSTALQEFTRATNVRLRLLRTKTLLGHLMSVARQDPSVTRRYFYSIKDISIGGRCVCNGHADVCDITDPNDLYKLQCRCQHNTCGSQCETCCPGFIQKKWRPAGYQDGFVCEPCNCYGHTDECIFDDEVNSKGLSIDIYGVYEGGGVCQNCQHNTEGINCDKCKAGFYRPYDRELNDTDVCQPCQCNVFYSTGNCAEGSGQCECRPEFLPPYCQECNDGYYDYPDCKPCDCHRNGTVGGVCEVGGGQCPCKENYQGLNCDECAPGYYNFPECLPCDCNDVGSLNETCDIYNGQCSCENNFGGRACERCEHGYFDYPSCNFCNCDARGTEEEICDKDTGGCMCLVGYSGNRCDGSAPGFWGYPLIQSCGCHERGSASSICDASGDCACLGGFAGRACDQCSPGYYNFPECMPCNCDQAGSIGISCDHDGKCRCKPNYDGVHCDMCREGFYNFPLCEECNCNPAGVLETFAGCGNAPVGELCECKERVTGRICNMCKPLFWNLRYDNPMGCEDCACHTPGTIGGVASCDSETGQCFCKPGVAARRCNECRDGTFNLLDSNLFGCSDCGCNQGGSVDNFCDKISGQCRCKPRVTGQRCDEVLKLHYFPTFYQLKYEAEDGHTPQNTAVRFGYDEEVFPGYSWRGYAVFSDIQKEIIHEVYIEKPSLYRMLMYYRNPSSRTIVGTVRITPDNPSDTEQEDTVYFLPTSGPELMTVVRVPGDFPVHLVMNPGRWTVSIVNSQNLFLDYFVLLPEAYYEGTILTENITTACMIGQDKSEMCVHYAYPDVFQYDYIYGSAGYKSVGGERLAVDLFSDDEVLAELETQPMAWLNHNQPEVQYDIRLTRAGRYILLINYYTPSGATTTNVIVETSTLKGREKGRAILYDCMFSTTCRQAVTDLSGQVGVFHFDSNFISVNVKGETNTNIGIDSIVAVPYDLWHQDLVRPQPKCTRKDGVCQESFYPFPPETTKIEFESNLEGKMVSVLPAGMKEGTSLVYLNHSDPMVDITGQLNYAGYYVFVVHYYQPYYPDAELNIQIAYDREEEFDLNVLLQNGQFYEGSLPVHHCPSISGCRAVIKQTDGSHVFDILENFVLSLKEPNHKSIWLDYLLVIPAAQYTEEVLHELPHDKTAEFIRICGENNFNVPANATGFCKDAAFKLTMDYNNGALECECDFYGSESFECEEFGGQCPCRPNVIGRKCNRCKTGFFGFPDCKPCDCPSTALCDPVSGECICPPRVEGDRCERCAPFTYGFDPIIGCEECQCSPLGVRAGNLQCELENGQCDCKENVVGRRCERCEAGYWSFPFCQLCDCDLRGTEADICNQDDASCFCKSNVQGRACDACQAGSYNLEESNPNGCTKCFCFGKSEYCSSADAYWEELMMNEMTAWEVVVVEQTSSGESSLSFSSLAQEPSRYEELIVQDLSTIGNIFPEGHVFFSAHDIYLGNSISSYGGFFRYSLLFVKGDNGTELTGPDVILTGSNVIALYYSEYDPATSQVFDGYVRLTEHSFRTLSGAPLQRDQFMMLLYGLDGIFIRASYWSNSVEARLYNVSMEAATINWPGPGARSSLSVELCQCPVNYQGSSCEECADGYYRAQQGPYGGYCVQCQCNGHASTCDKVTGKCLNCLHNTVGDYCEMCAPGYHGDATRGTPYDCLICACPMPSITNNFADSCEVTHDGASIKCDCQEGYIGGRCERCASGYYGQPEVLGDKCRPCECNENIEVEDPFACDDITGRCLNCLNNTFGDSCERCAPGFYGDAVTLKNCESCTCDECGTRNCQHFSGVCECYENVIGNDCSECAPDHWGFASCQGCQPCICGVASVSTQCDRGTGQCECRGGVGGQRCTQCKPGYWNYSELGCQECTCREGFSIGVGCDPLTGQCSCLPGVIGANCDGCPYRWVLIDGVGCRECDECVHALLDTTDELSRLIEPTIVEFESAAYSYFLNQRLEVINSTMKELKPKVALMDISEEDTKPIEDELEAIRKEAQAVSGRAGIVLDRAGDSAGDGSDVHKEALDVEMQLNEAFYTVRDIIGEINSLVIGLETGAGAHLEQAINEAEIIVAVMQDRNFEEFRDKVEVELELSKELLDKINLFYEPVKEHNKAVGAYADQLKDFDKKLEEMQGFIQKAQMQTKDAGERNRNNKLFGYEALKKKIEEANRVGKEVDGDLEKSRNRVDEANKNYLNASMNYEELLMELERLHAARSTLNTTVLQIVQELEEAQLPAMKAKEHAEVLKTRADNLDSLLADTREFSEKALAAANAYMDIVKAIEDARQAAEAAKEAAMKAMELSGGVSDDAVVSQGKSEEKYEMAEWRSQQVESELQPQLAQAENDVRTLRDMNTYISDTVVVIGSALDRLQQESIADEASRLKENAIQSRDLAGEAILNIANVEEQISDVGVRGRQLMKNVAAGEKAIELSGRQVEQVEQQVPEMMELAASLRQKKESIQMKGINVGDRLKELRRSIQKTRELANKIKVGVEFQPNTTIELQNPEDITKAATSTKVSMFVRTDEPSGLLMFMGTPVGGSKLMRRTKTDDFMALEMDSGFVRLTMDLGDGSHSIENNKLRIDDGIWREVRVDRTGKLVKLSIVYEDEDKSEAIASVEHELPGTFSVFNLDPGVSKIFIGGIPPGVQVDSAIRSTSFYGQVEDFRLSDRPIGLWNFMSNGTNNIQQRGALERDQLVDLVPPTGLRFDGNGYAAMDTRNGYRFKKKFDLQLDFKTYAEDGILFFISGADDQYIAVTMEEGHVLFQFNLGTGVATMRSEETYHDGEWHHVEVAREQNRGIMKVDSKGVQGESPGTARLFTEVPQSMYFGGLPGEHEFIDTTNDDFDGCIDNIVMSSVAVDLSKSTETLSAAPGCPVKVASLVSFEKMAPGYVKHTSPDGTGLQLTFKFKTDQPDGLIFYTTTRNQDSYVSLSLAESALILRAAPGGELSTGSYNKYNDSEWHVVNAIREHNQLRLHVDDFEDFKVSVAQPAVPFDGPVFFGGVPAEYNIAAAASATDTNFFGCIGDVTLNSKIVNFAESTDRPRALLQKCHLVRSSSYFHSSTFGAGRETNTSGPGDTLTVQIPEVVEVDFDSSSYPPPYVTSDSSPQLVTSASSPFPTTPPSTTEIFTSTTEEILAEVDETDLAESCALPVEPAEEEIDESAGFRFDEDHPVDLKFGSRRNSRIEFDTLPTSARGDFKFSFDFKTSATEGVIFYASDDMHRDVIAIYMKDGKIVMRFNPGDGAAQMRSQRAFNDGLWHSAVVERNNAFGVLYVDGYQEGNGTSKGTSKFIDLKAPYYYGGISAEIADQARANTEETDLSFNGCLRIMRMNNQRLSGAHQAFGLNRCSENVEPGIFFSEGIRAHVVLRQRFSVGRVFEMKMDIKPRKNNGVIMSVHGRRDFVLLQLRNGSVELTVDNGKGEIVNRYTPSSPWTICDGKWHTIQVIKNKIIAILIVDGTSTNPVSGKIGATSTDTKHPLFLGTQPRITQRRGNGVAEKFVGCIRNVSINKEAEELPYATFVGQVNAGSCPTI